MSTTTTNMGLKVLQVNDPSPGYVNDLATTVTLLDTHDHSTGKGTPVTQSGILLSGPLSANGQSIVNLNGLRFQNVIQQPGPADGGTLYMFNGDLYFWSPTLAGVRITYNGRISGIIGGDYNTYPQAAINYIHSQLAYLFVNGNGTNARGIFSAVQLQSGVNNVVLSYDPSTGLSVQDNSGNYANINLGTVARLASSYIQWDGANTQFTFKDNMGALTKGNFGSLATSGNVGITGALTVGGTLGVTGNSTFGSTLNAVGAFTASSTSSLTGNTTVGGTLTSTGAFTASSTSQLAGNTTVGGTLNAVGGVTQGSRYLALRGTSAASSTSGSTTSNVNTYMAASTPAFASTVFVAPYAGSIAAMAVRAYNNVGTAGTLAVTTTGLTTNPSTAAFSTSAVTAGAYQTFAPGVYTFNAGTAMSLNIVSSGWAQSGGGVESMLWVYC